MAVSRIGHHFTVPRPPQIFRFRIEPDDPTAAVAHLSQNCVFGIHVVGAGITDDDESRFPGEQLHVVFLKIPQGFTIVRRCMIVDIFICHDEPDGLTDLMFFESFCNVSQLINEDEAAYFVKALLK